MSNQTTRGMRHSVEIVRNSHFHGNVNEISHAFSKAESDAAFARIAGWPNYQQTPLIDLPSAANKLNVGALYCKDEGGRLGISSFKALGAVYASVCVVSSLVAKRTGRDISDADLLAGKHADDVRGIVLACATDGNHGFSVTHAARLMGCEARIFIPRGVTATRENALRDAGARVVRVDGIYEEAVDAARLAAESEPDAHIISDYGTADYQDVPRLCMVGYSVMTQEIARQLGNVGPTHIFAPAGCGGLAAAMISSAQQQWSEAPPRVVVVEPVEADCVLASAQAGELIQIDGDLETIMGGLSCAAPSHAAWPTLKAGAFAFMRMTDDAAVDAMRFLAAPSGADPRIVAGETGAAGMGAFLAIHDDPKSRAALDIDENSRVLVIACEGAADPDLYRKLVGSL
jgi:diaminopropionate ammonia-lyase